MSEELSKNDLFILMESYKNNIQLNTTLLEQQKQMMVMNGTSIEKQEELYTKVDELIGKITSCSNTISDNNSKLMTSLTVLSASITTQTDQNFNKLSKEHDKLSFKLYIAFIGMTGIILSIIGLAINFADKYHSLSDLLKTHIGG